MKRKFLEDLGLEKETIDKIMAENGKDVEKVKSLTEEVEQLKNQVKQQADEIKQRDTQLEQLKESGADNEELKHTIENLQEENKELTKKHAEEINAIKVENAVTNALTTAGAKNIKAVRALLQLDGAELDEVGAVKGLDEQIKALTESDSFLFSKQPTLRGVEPGESKDGLPVEKRVNEMNYTELCAYMEANPDAKI